ncbi:hypothetical protein Y1Q_0022382 [Alligator mississippiensis]|uniref:Uncharacterized protein n=1 Tax=Alligator mississippiensis TaxID=8496 RepID=A0A151P1F2_ALLMI|nr:hypothetical protein Y1Q_0022382 [Alligator mississippiensis]
MTSRNSQSQWELGSVRIYIWGRSDLVFLLGWAWLVVGSVVGAPEPAGPLFPCRRGCLAKPRAWRWPRAAAPVEMSDSRN